MMNSRTSQFLLRTAALGIAATALSVAPVSAHQNTGARVGSVDRSYGQGGRAVAHLRGNDAAYDAALDHQGRMVVAGSTAPSGGVGPAEFALTRFTKSGKVDHSFGENGDVVTAINDPVPGYDFDTSTVHAIAIDAKNRIVACGDARLGTDSDFALARFKADGKLDHSFGDDGVQTTGFNSVSDSCRAVAIDHNGRIDAVGTTGPYFAFARYTRDGQLDTSFQSSGRYSTTMGYQGPDSAEAVAVDGSKIVVAGHDANSIVLARFDYDGSYDQTFNSGLGHREYPSSGDSQAVDALEVDSKGRYVVGGASTSSGTRSILARVNASSKLDRSFSKDGMLTYGQGFNGAGITSLALDRGRPVAVSISRPDQMGDVNVSVRRFSSAGVVDHTFHDVGTRFASKGSSFGAAVAVTKKGYLIGGSYHSGARTGYGVVRLLSEAKKRHHR